MLVNFDRIHDKCVNDEINFIFGHWSLLCSNYKGGTN